MKKQQKEYTTLKTIDYRALLDAMPDAVWIYDKNYKTILVNHAGSRNVIIPRNNIIGHTLQECFPNIESTKFFEAHKKALEKHLTTAVEGPQILANGNKRWWRMTFCPVPRGVLSISHDITKSKKIQNQLKYSRSQLRALANRVQSIREEERTRIAREIHDELGMLLTNVKIDLSWLATQFTRNETQPQTMKVHEIMRSIETSIQIVRRVASDLRPGILDDIGLGAAIEWQTLEFQNRTGIRCSCTISQIDSRLEKKRSTELFRIYQEILTNIARHAVASRVDIILTIKEDTLILQVQDNGKGITDKEVNNPQSLGLLGMRERILPYHGSIIIKGMPSKGTIIRVSIPYKIK
jgi:PAS domain S-box-containing protein